MTQDRHARLFNRDFLIWWLGGAQSQFGSSLASIALSFLVLEKTGSAGAMGVTLALGILPTLLSPLAGALVDRLPLKLPLIGGDLARGVLQLGVGAWALHGDLPLSVINAAALLTGLAGVFSSPAAGAALPRLVAEEHLLRAGALIGTAQQTASLVGLLGGGLLVSRLGSAQALLIDAASFFVMAALLPFVALPKYGANTERTSLIGDIRDGLRLMRRSRILTFLPLIAFFLNAVMAPIQMLLPKLMLTFGVGAAGYGSYLAAESVGMLGGSALLAWLGARAPLKVLAGAGLAVIGGAVLLVGVTPAYPPLLAWGALLGLGIACTNTPIFTLIQQLVPPAYLGRVFSVLMAAATLGMPATLLALAPIADSVPGALIFGAAGAGCLASALAWALVARADTVRGPASLSQA